RACPTRDFSRDPEAYAPTSPPATTPISIPMAICTLSLLARLSACYRGSHPALVRRTGVPNRCCEPTPGSVERLARTPLSDAVRCREIERRHGFRKQLRFGKSRCAGKTSDEAPASYPRSGV